MINLIAETRTLQEYLAEISLRTVFSLTPSGQKAIEHLLSNVSGDPNADSNYLFLSERGPLTRQAANYLTGEMVKWAKLNFKITPHMLRHSIGYCLANRGYDTRLIQDYLRHKNITHTVKYTRTTASRFENLWRQLRFLWVVLNQ
jgi:type 1 fimbriae regulatory protein FimB